MIRKLRKADLEEVALIWLDTNIRAHDFIPAKYWKGHFAYVKEMLLQAEVYVYENEDEKKILGFIGLDHDYIAGIFVRHEEQSNGIGRCLLDFVKGRKDCLKLHVYQKNMDAIRFYLREGFFIESELTEEETGEKEFLMGLGLQK